MMAVPAGAVTLRYVPRGAMRAIFAMHDPELVLAGPAGTGKSRGILEKVHLACLKHPHLRALMLRKTRRSLTESGMVTYAQKVCHPGDGVHWRPSDQEYQYPNGAILAVGGLDKPQKVMSSEWDLIYVQEATDLTETDWEALTTRLRNGKNSYQQLIADCNPDTPTHWLKSRSDAGRLRMLDTRHEDNPVLFDDMGVITAEGERYLKILDSLTGVRYLRLRKGLWVAAEGIVYEGSWDRALNLIDAFKIPAEWPRYLTIDFGYTNPFVCQWWAEDPDGRLYLYREIYMTHRLVEDHCKDILHEMGYGLQHGRPARIRDNAEPLPRAVICDHDAEDRATCEKHLGMPTLPANKNVSAGIQHMAGRLRPAGDGKPRMYLIRDAVVRRDQVLIDAKKPASTAEEIEGYVWDIGGGRAKGEAPLKKDDHGCDAARYMAARELTRMTVGKMPTIWR